METLGIILIAYFAYTVTQESDGVTEIIPLLGVFAIAAQRLLPIMQQAYSSWSAILGNHASLLDTLDLLDQKLPNFVKNLNNSPLKFEQEISLNQLFFRYNEKAPWVIQNLELKIDKGSKIGFVGTTGSGKSTLLDIIMGLLSPTTGFLKIDGVPITPENQRFWHSHIAHVPQTIFLSDGTIEENIAFGVPKKLIDHDRVVQSARKAQIAHNIDSWSNRYQTIVGERGIRLSGGQRQRIGIARALYKEADVIILDEATSALDNETEEAIMSAIDKLSPHITVLIIAHRISTLRNCSHIVKLNHGRIESVCSYSDLVTNPY